MEKDKFDNGLREKLGNARLDPPPDMWERIAATLKEQGLTAAEPIAGAPTHTSGVRRMRRLRAGYAAVAAAAAILIGAVIFGINHLQHDRSLVADDTAIEQQSPVSVDASAVWHDNITSTEQLQKPHEITTSPVRQIAKNEAIGQATEPAPKITPPTASQTEKTEQVGEPQAIKDEGINTDMGTKKEWVDRNEIERMLKGTERKRKNAPVKVGLYSARMGEDASEKTVRSTPYADASSDFVVNEFFNEANDAPFAQVQSDTKLKHNVPVTVGLSITKPIIGRLSLESGVTYSYLLSRGEKQSTNGGTYNIKRELHYVGVTVGVKYDLLRTRRFDLYTSASGLFEMCVSSRRKLSMKNDDMSGEPKSESLNVKGIQPSIAAYAGAEIKLAKNLGLYVEPGMSYYFDVDQPENFRTEHPLNFSLRAGLRISLR